MAIFSKKPTEKAVPAKPSKHPDAVYVPAPAHGKSISSAESAAPAAPASPKEQAADKAAAQRIRRSVPQVLGDIAWLMMQSPHYKQLFISDLEWFLMPPISLGQFRMYFGPRGPEGMKLPAGCLLWAMVSDETERRLLAGSRRLRPDEWKSGERAWLIESIAPFGAQDEMVRELAASVFAGTEFKYHVTTKDGVRRVASSDQLKKAQSTA